MIKGTRVFFLLCLGLGLYGCQPTGSTDFRCNRDTDKGSEYWGSCVSELRQRADGSFSIESVNCSLRQNPPEGTTCWLDNSLTFACADTRAGNFARLITWDDPSHAPMSVELVSPIDEAEKIVECIVEMKW